MKKSEVIQNIVDVLTGIQAMSGRAIVPISEKTCPIGDLDQFDSLNGVEATVELSSRLGVDLTGVNTFVNASGTKALTVSDVAECICSLTARKETSK